MGRVGAAGGGSVIEQEVLGGQHQSLRSMIEIGSRRSSCQATVPIPNANTISGMGSVCSVNTFQSKMFIKRPCGTMKVRLNQLSTATPRPTPMIQAASVTPNDSSATRMINPQRL